jgi:hypothetical protein
MESEPMNVEIHLPGLRVPLPRGIAVGKGFPNRYADGVSEDEEQPKTLELKLCRIWSC